MHWHKLGEVVTALYIIILSWPFFCQKLSMLVEIWQSYAKKILTFLRHGVYSLSSGTWQKARMLTVETTLCLNKTGATFIFWMTQWNIGRFWKLLACNDLCISQGSVATVLTWGGLNYSYLYQVSCRLPKIIKIGQCFRVTQ